MRACARLAAVLPCAGLLWALAAGAEPAGEALSGDEVVRQVNARDEGRALQREIQIELVDARGAIRRRQAVIQRLYDDGVKKLAFYYTEPRSLRGTALLSWDEAEAEKADAVWLYLPAVRKSRRIAANQRGELFMGTDFSYEDLKKGTRLSEQDYRWRRLADDERSAGRCLRVEGTPVDADTASALGYGRVVVCVDPARWLVLDLDYWDPAGQPLKSARVSEVRQVDGYWTPHRIEVQNHRSGHRTRFDVTRAEYGDLPPGLFTERQLRRGPP